MQNTFIEINKTNSYGDKGVAFIRIADIMGIKEQHVESVKLYNENGDLVSETPGEKLFGVLVATERGSKETFYVDQAEYERLKDLLNK